MAFENLTLFELHLENSRFGPGAGSGEDESSESSSGFGSESGGSGGRGRRMARPLGMLLLLVVVGLAVRRYRSGGASGEGASEDSEQITIEHATEQ